jgi:hypothetical protein
LYSKYVDSPVFAGLSILQKGQIDNFTQKKKEKRQDKMKKCRYNASREFILRHGRRNRGMDYEKAVYGQ